MIGSATIDGARDVVTGWPPPSPRPKPVTHRRPPPSHRRPPRWWIFFSLALAQFIVALDITIVNIALPDVQTELGFSDAMRQWVVGGYTLAYGGLLLLGGRIGERIGYRSAFLLGLVGFAVASIIAASSEHLATLIAGRVLQGTFGALLAPATLAQLIAAFEGTPERARAFGIYSVVGGISGAAGFLAGGALTGSLGWRWTFYIGAWLVIPALLATIGLFPHLQGKRVRSDLDIIGSALGALGIIAITYGSAITSWPFIGGGALLLALFMVRQATVAYPLLPPRVLADRDRGASYLALAVCGVEVYGMLLFVTYYLQRMKGFTALATGAAFVPMVIALVAASFLTSALLKRIGPKLLVPAGMAFGAAGMLWLSLIEGDAGYWRDVAPALFLGAIGLGIVANVTTNFATGDLGPGDVGPASATVHAVQSVGGSIGLAALNAVAISSAGYEGVFRWSAAIFVLAGLSCALLYRTRRTGTALGAPPQHVRPAEVGSRLPLHTRS